MSWPRTTSARDFNLPMVSMAAVFADLWENRPHNHFYEYIRYYTSDQRHNGGTTS